MARINENASISRETQRSCIVSGETLLPEQMVRFVISPDGDVTPDLAQKLPGRGYWVRARKDDINRAVETKMFLKASKSSITPPVELAAQVEQLLVRRLEGLLGLARKTGKIVLGFAKVASAVENGGAFLVLHASDGMADGKDKVGRFAKRNGVPVYSVLDSQHMSAALGGDNIVHAAIKDVGWAKRLKLECDRIEGYQP